jgi:hypothetical protein
LLFRNKKKCKKTAQHRTESGLQKDNIAKLNSEVAPPKGIQNICVMSWHSFGKIFMAKGGFAERLFSVIDGYRKAASRRGLLERI